MPEPLAVGEGPTTWAAYFNQQYRWAFGCMDIFFSHSPRISYKMRLKHGLLYFLLEQFYFSGLAMLVAAALLMVYYLLGWAPARIQCEQLAWWYGPLLCWRQLIPFWLQRFNVRPRAERGLFWAGRFLTIAALAMLLGHTSPIFLAWGSVTAALLFSFFFAKFGRRIVITLRNSRAVASAPAVSSHA